MQDMSGHDRPSARVPSTRDAGFAPIAAAAAATAAYVVPYAMSRPTTPSPDHPRIFLWYRSLSQPWFKPPDLAIPIAWLLLQTGLCVGGFRLMRKPSTRERNQALSWWAANILGIGGWNYLFFGRRSLLASTIGAATLVATSATYVAKADKVDRPAAAASVPLVGWVVFATILTAVLWKKNR